MEAIASYLKQILGEHLVGAYLHGSGALGGYISSASDLDVLAVSARALTAREKGVIAGALVNEPCPARGLEFSLVTLASIRSQRLPLPFEIHVSTESRIEVIDGAGREGDYDLVLYCEICRRHGHPLLGASPTEVFPAAPRSLLLNMCDRELRWIEDNFTRATLQSSVLQACRAWCFLEEDVLCSKISGGVWAMDRLHGEERWMVTAAIQLKSGKGKSRLDPTLAMAYVSRVRQMFKRI